MARLGLSSGGTVTTKAAITKPHKLHLKPDIPLRRITLLAVWMRKNPICHSPNTLAE